MPPADLLALKNLARTGEGRRVLAGQAIVLASIAMLGFGLGSATLLRPVVRQAVQDDPTGADLLDLCHLVVMLPVLFVAVAGMPVIAKQLYVGSHLPLLLSAPVPALRIVAGAMLRTGFGWLLFTAALIGPLLTGMVARLGLSWWTALSTGLQAALWLLPTLAAVTLAKVVVVRWCSGPRWRCLTLLVPVAAQIALVIALLLGIVRGDAFARRLVVLLADASAAPARWRPLLSWPALAIAVLGGLALLAVASACYRRSFEVHLLTGASRPWRTRGRPWPTSPLRSLLLKAALESIRVRGNLVFLGSLCVLLVGWFVTSGVRAPPNDRVPTAVWHAFLLLQPWQTLSLLMSTILFLAVIGSDQKQIVLLATSPLPRRTLLLSKVWLLGWPFALTMAVTVLAAIATGGATPSGMGGYLLAGVPVLLATLAVLLVVGSWPAWIRVHDDLPLANNLGSVLPSIAIGLAGVVGLVLQARAQRWIVRTYEGRGPWPELSGDLLTALLLAAAWLGSLCMLWLALRIAARNFTRLLGPQVE